MNTNRALSCAILLIISLTAFAARNRTYDEAMERHLDNPYVHEIGVAEYEFHYGYQYGKYIWLGTETADVASPSQSRSSLPDLNDTFMMIDTITLGPEAGLESLLFGFSGCGNRDCRIRNASIAGYNHGLEETVIPNIAYYRYLPYDAAVDDEEALEGLFDSAVKLYEMLYAKTGNCHLNGWTEKRQFYVVKGEIFKRKTENR